MQADYDYALKERHTLGVYWDELPAIVVNSLNVDYAYPKDQPFEKSHLIKWLNEISF